MKARHIILIALSLSLCLAAQARKKPLIGIVPGYNGSMSSTVSRSYTDAVARAGGIPLILPQVDDPVAAAEIVGRLDGILFTGGVDIDPAHYGETVLNESVEIDSHRDAIDMLYAGAAIGSKLPILGICRGEQLLNVVLGGSLYQDLPTQKPSDIAHRQKEEFNLPSHKIIVAKGSLLHDIMKKDTLLVNSAHHQAVKAPSDKILVTAYAPDGVVEAYQGTERGRWLLAVQFHPEALVRVDDSWLALFKAFVKACR